MSNLRDKRMRLWARSCALTAGALLVLSASAITSAATQGFLTDGSSSDLALISPEQDKVFLLIRKTNGTGLMIFKNAGGGVLDTNPQQINVGFSSGPVTVSWGANHAAAFIKGNDNAIKMLTWSNNLFDSWSGPTDLGGSFHFEPGAVSMAPGHYAVFAKGASNDNLYVRQFNGGAWAPSWTNLGGGIYARPMAVSWGSGHMAVFIKGGGSNPFYYKQWNGSSWSPSWINIGGSFPHFPVPVSRGPGLIDVFGIGNDGKIYVRHYNGTSWVPSGWTSIGTKTFSSSPAVVVMPNGTLKVYARSHLETFQGNSVYVLYSNASTDGGYTWSGWQAVDSAEKAAGSNPAATVFTTQSGGIPVSPQVALMTGVISGAPPPSKGVINYYQLP